MAAGEGSSPGTGHAGPIRTRTTSLLHSVRRKGPSGPSGFFSSGEDNNAFGFTTEFGWYLPIADRAYVEPMVTLAYGRIAGDSYTLKNGVKYEEENMDSLLADIGARAGYKFANNRGSVYAKGRLLRGFQGDVEATARLNTAVNSYKEDLGDTYAEFGAGASFSLTEATKAFLSLERTTGGDVKTNWRWNVGIRHAF